MQTDDKALIEAFQTGDEFAFVSLYNRHKGGVYAFCLKMLLDRELAQDVTQDTFLRIYENRDRLLNVGAFRAWLYTIARNQCLNQLRRSGRHVAFEPGRNQAEPASETPVSRMEKHEQVEMVTRFLSQLKPEYREVLVLREYQNLSYEEIAAVTRSTISSVKSRLFKARRKLAHYWEPLLKAEAARVEPAKAVPLHERTP